MSRIGILVFCLFCFSCQKKKAPTPSLQTYESAKLSDSTKSNVISFGSCNHEDDPQTIWKTIVSNDPDLWIWMGDNVYGDANMSKLKSKYDLQKSHEAYISFNKEVPIIGTWDDHDYGQNDGNKSFAKKEESKKLMLDFLDVDKSRDVWKRAGVYDSYLIGKGKERIKIILLDTRSFQDVLEKDTKTKARYLKGDGDVLGSSQWQWLEKELSNNEAEVTLIVTSIQFLSAEHNYEKWANFPKARNKMLELLKSSDQKNVIFLSGDRHVAEVSKMDLEGLNYPLYDITSSGMTHSYEAADEQNQYRVSPLNGKKNFGVLYFNWTDNKVEIKVKIKGTDGEELIGHNLGSYSL